MTPLIPKKIVIASSNQGKLKEFDELFRQIDVSVLPQSTFHIDDVEETGMTFIENAIIKARHAAKISGLPAIADDSGIAVDALNGAPGIYSARYAGKEADDQKNITKLLNEMQTLDNDKRTARFHCVLAYLQHESDPIPLIFHGTWAGLILQTPQGSDGFGYDPVFYVPEKQCTAAELPKDVKNKLSHRAKAMALFKQHFFI